MGLWNRIKSGYKFCFKIGDVQEYIDYIKNNLDKIETIYEAPENVQTAVSNMRSHDINYRLNNFHSNVLHDYDKYTGLANNHNIKVKKLYEKVAEFNQLYTDTLNNPISFSINLFLISFWIYFVCNTVIRVVVWCLCLEFSSTSINN